MRRVFVGPGHLLAMAAIASLGDSIQAIPPADGKTREADAIEDRRRREERRLSLEARARLTDDRQTKPELSRQQRRLAEREAKKAAKPR